MHSNPEERRRYQREYYRNRAASKKLRAAASARWHSKRRKRIFQRDGYRCHYCEQVYEAKDLHLDHLIPTSKGGSNEDDNITTACRWCNQRRVNKPTCANCRSWAKPERVDAETLRCVACGGINTFPPGTPAYDPNVEPDWVSEQEKENGDAATS